MKIFEKKFVFEKKDVSLWRHGAKGCMSLKTLTGTRLFGEKWLLR